MTRQAAIGWNVAQPPRTQQLLPGSAVVAVFEIRFARQQEVAEMNYAE